MYITENSKYYADSMAFFGLQGRPPVFDPSKRPLLSLAPLTRVPPFVKSFKAALAAHRLFREQALSKNSGVHEIRTRADLSGRPESMGLLFGMQHAPEGLTLKRVRQLQDAGIRSMAIAYDKPTEYGDGFQGGGQLTARGNDLVSWLGECGIILDLSHAGYRTAMDAMTLILLDSLQTKVMASHSGCYEVYPHPRNLSDNLIRRIHFQNGYIGIPAITFLIAKKGDSYLAAFARHVAHAIRVCGDSEFIGVGSDCNHLNMTIEDARMHFKNMLRMLKTNGTFREYFPDRPPEVILDGSHMFDYFDEALKWSSDGVLGEHFKNFLARAL